MKVRGQIAMVLNLDKCIGCHTCSVTCKNVWTSREGVEYVWWNNVETKPGIGYPKHWENQEKYKGGWEFKGNKLTLKQGGRTASLAKIFGNPNMPEIDDYYEPFTFDFGKLQFAKESRTQPVARPRSLLTGKTMEKIEWGPNFEDMMGGEFKKRSEDKNFDDINKSIYEAFEQSFMFHLPRLCEHCLNPTCVAACPSGSIYKREEDGIVLVDQDKCRGWRMCVSACPYKKIYYNWKTGKAEKCTFCYPRIEQGEPTVCSESCVGRIRYLGVLLYDADKIEEAASQVDEKDLYKAQLELFLDPNDEKVIQAAKESGIDDNWLEAAKNSPAYKLAIDWKLAFPLHPEYRTLPMVWYVPPLSPIQAALHTGHLDKKSILQDSKELRIPSQYLANLLTAGDVEPIELALKRLLCMREVNQSKRLGEALDESLLESVSLSEKDIKGMTELLSIANYEDRFVIPTAHREKVMDAYHEKGECGFSFGDGCDTPMFETAVSKSRQVNLIPTVSLHTPKSNP